MMHAGQRPSGIRRYKRLSPASIRKAVSTLHALFEFATKRGWASKNPVHALELPELARNEDIRFLTPAEVQAVAASAVPGAHEAIDRALYVTAAMTGLREGELIALRWLDVDWTAARVRVRQNYVLGEFGTPKSKRSTRCVPMADAVAAELERLYPRTEARTGRAPSDSSLVLRIQRPADRSTRRCSSCGFGKHLRQPGWTRPGVSTTYATPSGHRWPPRASRCALCRSGWDTATSRRRCVRRLLAERA
jgi:integrase